MTNNKWAKFDELIYEYNRETPNIDEKRLLGIEVKMHTKLKQHITDNYISKEEVREIIESHKGIYDKRIDPIECEEIYKRDNALLQEIIDSLNLK